MYMTQKITSQYFHFSKYQIQRSHHAISDLFPVLSDVAVKWDETLKSLPKNRTGTVGTVLKRFFSSSTVVVLA